MAAKLTQRSQKMLYVKLIYNPSLNCHTWVTLLIWFITYTVSFNENMLGYQGYKKPVQRADLSVISRTTKATDWPRQRQRPRDNNAYC
jgi:hypothetical protein